jgi:hypothetical protein
LLFAGALGCEEAPGAGAACDGAAGDDGVVDVCARAGKLTASANASDIIPPEIPDIRISLLC